MPVLGGNAINHARLYAGMVVDMQLCNGVSKRNDETDTIAFGLGVVSNGDDGMILPIDTSTAAQFIGVVKYELNRAYQDGETFGARPAYDATVITHGVVAVVPTLDVTKDDSVFMIIGDGSLPNANLGKFTNVIGATTETAVQISGAKWLETATAGTVTKISLGIGG